MVHRSPYGPHMTPASPIWHHLPPICCHLAPIMLSENAHGSHAVHMAPMQNCMGPAYPMGKRWHHLGAAGDGWGPYESCVHHMGAMCNILEVDGSHMVPSASFTVPSGSHTVHKAQIWCTQLHMVPIWLMHHHYGTVCLPFCCNWCTWLPYGAICLLYSAIWLPCGAQGSNMAPIWHMHHQYSTIPICWSQILLSKMHMAPMQAPIPCTWHPNGACGSLCILW
jgi:hypothetical protein